MQSQKKLTPDQAWEKLKHYCAWQERCHKEVREKLAGMGVYGADTDQLIARLIEENYLNEERFAIQFAGGHFRTRQWGRRKIVYALRQKEVSDWCIKRALEEIPEEDYSRAMNKLAAAKWRESAKYTPAQRWARTRDYLMHKGFEGDMVLQWLRRQGGNQAAEE